MLANVQRQSRLGAPRLALCRAHHHHPKRLESDEPPTKCARLSESPPDGGLLPSPGSPLPPALHSADPQHTGPTCIGNYLLLPNVDRENVARALHLHTGEELQCKLRDYKPLGGPSMLCSDPIFDAIAMYWKDRPLHDATVDGAVTLSAPQLREDW